ncbi:hypothetical protein FQN60_014543 [Etheostoma spectabile]|uniref:EF-hand domain-containing protein n=1 Tax=Etheostoma spectabile TaxID=54343 RepID=A0A5J5DAM2_9PERO|nr:hypothetical protein FQN60_014543 [Etheostoma spectabile]
MTPLPPCPELINCKHIWLPNLNWSIASRTHLFAANQPRKKQRDEETVGAQGSSSPPHMAREKRSYINRLTSTMAAITAPCAATITTATAVARTAWQREGSSDKVSKRENVDVGQNTIVEKTFEFFQMCDTENKGFITRRDMQRLNTELPLSAEELENVFDTLDSDGNEYLTLEEFSSGFSEFLSGQKISVEEDMGEKNPCQSPAEVLYQTQWEESRAREEDEDEEEKHFCMLMENLGANSVFEEKAATHDDEIQRLYVEMEQQIKTEKDRIVLQDYGRFLSRSQDLELQLSAKEKELDQLFQKQRRLENQCQKLQSEQHVAKVENVKLKHTNEELARELDHTSRELAVAQDQLNLLQEQATQLHEEKEMEINKHLRDEKDILNQNPKNSKKTPSLKQRPSANVVKRTNTNVFRSEDEEEPTPSSVRRNLANGSGQSFNLAETRGHLQRIISIEEDHLPHLLQNDCQAQSPLQEYSEGEDASDNDEDIDLVMSNIYLCASSAQQQKSKGDVEKRETPTSPRVQPVGKETSIHEEDGPSPPDRLFKVVLVGNSGVGKTCLLKRFCDDCFHSGTCATVGIDYSVKTIAVDNSQVALQLWDTAGQERYRSITKQFFRKADGVVVMYDITSEQSFTAVRQWLTSVKEGAGEDIPVMLLGNKTDKEIERQDCQMISYECSACSGHNVVESMIHLASFPIAAKCSYFEYSHEKIHYGVANIGDTRKGKCM